MKGIITRADDYGSSHAANIAIAEAAKAGFIKNVSIMACGPFLEEAAELLAFDKNICFGLHSCINAEWDRVIWGPVAPREWVSSLIDHRNAFFQNPVQYAECKPNIEEIITEYQYQLERVRKAGFDIKYMDSHMLPERHIPGLQQEISKLIETEGLIDHMWFNQILKGDELALGSIEHFTSALIKIENQVLLILHPARYGEEMCKTGNKDISGETIARNREKDYQIAINKDILKMCEKNGIRLLRYDEAEKMDKPYEIKWVSLGG